MSLNEITDRAAASPAIPSAPVTERGVLRFITAGSVDVGAKD